MIPTKEAMIQLFLQLEHLADHHGWDQPPLRGVVAQVGKIYVPLPEIIPRSVGGTGDEDPLAIDLARQARAHQRHTNNGNVELRCAAVFHLWESWGHDNLTEQEIPPGLDVADVPGAYEVRMILALDCAGRTYLIDRQRGKTPGIYTGPFTPEDHQILPLLENLKTGLLNILDGYPDTAIDRAAVAKVGQG